MKEIKDKNEELNRLQEDNNTSASPEQYLEQIG
jgi:hypothetical protein